MRARLAWGVVVLSAMIGCRSGEIGMHRDGASAATDGPAVTGDAAPDGGVGADVAAAGDGPIGADDAGANDGGGGDTIPVPPGWELVWSEEFDTPGMPDPATWGYEVGYIRNNEEQYYTDARSENVRIENGALVIEARKDNWNGHAITSGSINTLGKRSFRYGRIEARALVPPGNGTWPAIWTLGTNIGTVSWPTCGEIDIMEYVGFEPLTIFGTVHMDSGAQGGNHATTTPWTDWHVYAIEWFTDRIDFYVDTTKYFTYPNDGGGNASWPFDQDQYLLLNLAIGGAWGGQHGVDDGIFPARYYVDYVRYYRQL
jgi:beta-glucanase (GH16 family)